MIQNEIIFDELTKEIGGRLDIESLEENNLYSMVINKTKQYHTRNKSVSLLRHFYLYLLINFGF